MQQMASDIFVRILRGMGACRKKPAQPASGSQLDDSIGNTPTTVSWRVWGYEVGLGWRLASSGISLPNNVFSWLLSDFTGPFSRPKNPSKTCAPQGASPEGGFQRDFSLDGIRAGPKPFLQKVDRDCARRRRASSLWSAWWAVSGSKNPNAS